METSYIDAGDWHVHEWYARLARHLAAFTIDLSDWSDLDLVLLATDGGERSNGVP